MRGWWTLRSWPVARGDELAARKSESESELCLSGQVRERLEEAVACFRRSAEW